MSGQTFLDAVAEGILPAEDIDEWIDLWHEERGWPNGRPQPLWDFLGFTQYEYQLWVEDSRWMVVILAARTYEGPYV